MTKTTRSRLLGCTAAALLIELDGVGATHGDSGQHLWVYSASDVTPTQIGAISRQLAVVGPVQSVHRLR